MPKKSRALTVDDVARIAALSGASPDSQTVYKAVEKLAGETIGWVMLTTLKYDEAAGVVVRLHSSNEKDYPLGGTKPISKITASRAKMDAGEPFLAPDLPAVKEAFFDHELIASLGISAILNAPIRHAGRRLGSLNFCGVEGMFGPDEIRNAQILAGLLIPSLLREFPG
jgi:GAF domain-containing protein